VIIIMTSNLGSDLILEAKPGGDLRALFDELLKRSFRPEFLNRIDGTVIFSRLGKDEIRSIVDIQLERLSRRLAARNITLTVTGGAKERLAERGYDPQFGARPLKRVIQQDLENPLAKAIIAGQIKEGDRISAGLGESLLEPDGALVFRREE
jgi:ATP-dependent Clp protease ATP-binding subunit ClpB